MPILSEDENGVWCKCDLCGMKFHSKMSHSEAMQKSMDEMGADNIIDASMKRGGLAVVCTPCWENVVQPYMAAHGLLNQRTG